MYIGQQQIISEKPLENGLVEVTLKALEIDQIGEIEIAVYNEGDLEKLKTEESNDDLTKLRDIRVEPIVQDIMLTFYKHNLQIEDLQHVSLLLNNSLMIAQQVHERTLYNNHELKRSVYQFRDSLLG